MHHCQHFLKKVYKIFRSFSQINAGFHILVNIYIYISTVISIWPLGGSIVKGGFIFVEINKILLTPTSVIAPPRKKQR